MDVSATTGANGANAPAAGVTSAEAAPPTASRPKTPGNESLPNPPLHDSSSPVVFRGTRPAKTVEDDLLDALDNIKSAGSFAAFKALEATNLVLSVKDVGEIALPLQESQARQIIEKARQAPYGRGEQTVVDTSVRNTWELDPSQFDLLGKGWESLHATVVAAVGRDLGVDSPIRAELYKMLVYEKGAMFKAHTDSPKIPGMFGTLVVVLPSAHEGGDVVVKHRHEKKVFKSSRVTQGFMCWYSDVQHEVLPVTSGYRWVLTYNLAVDPSDERPSAGLLGGGLAQLRGAVRQWLKSAAQFQKEKHLIYALDHHYTEASISLKGFKGRDAAVVQALRGISKELPMDFFLGILEKTEMGSCEFDYYGGGYSSRGRGYYYYTEGEDEDDEDDEDDVDWHNLADILETELGIKKLVDLDGIHLAENIRLDEDSILQQDCFEDVDGEEISYDEGYSGNEGGPQATHAYQVSGVVMVPRKSLSSFWKAVVERQSGISRRRDETNLWSLLTYFTNKCNHPSRDRPDWLIVGMLCLQSWEAKSPYGYQATYEISTTTATDVLKAAVRMRDWEFFEKAVENIRGEFDSEFFNWVKEETTNGLPFAEVQKPLLQAVLSLPTLSDALAAVATVSPPAPDSHLDTDGVQEWERTTLEAVLDTAESRSLGYADGASMVRHCILYNGIDYIRRRLVPLMEKQAKRVPFTLGFLAEIASEALKSEPAQKHQALEIYESVAKALISAMDIPAIASVASVQSHIRKAARNYREPVPSPKSNQNMLLSAVESKWLASFCDDLFSLQTTDNLATQLSLRIAGAAHQIKADEFSYIWLPLLERLAVALEKHAVPLATPAHQRVFVAVLDAYLARYVGKEEARPTSLVRPTVRCDDRWGSCGDCADLNRFLASADERVGRFAVNQGRRRHLHQGLDGARVDCRHETERVGSPYTLVVTKTFKHYDEARRLWLARRAEAEQWLMALARKGLQALLGDDNYARIVGLDDVRLPPQPRSNGRVLAPTTASAANSQARPGAGGPAEPPVHAGVKRKAAEVIDLTELV